MDLDNKLIIFSAITITVLICLSLAQTVMLKRRLVKAKLLWTVCEQTLERM